MFSLDTFKSTYDVEIHYVTIRGRKISYFLPCAIEPFIDVNFPMNDFPLWAKVWHSSVVLADFMATLGADPEKRILEIGSGIGIVGIAAAAFGHRVTITEYNTDAIEFARANAVINGLPMIPVLPMNWNNPQSMVQYDKIIGSEVIFREQDFEPIQKLFQSMLRPGGEIILVSEIRKPVLEFYGKMQKHYQVNAQQRILRSENEEIKIILCRMKPIFSS